MASEGQEDIRTAGESMVKGVTDLHVKFADIGGKVWRGRFVCYTKMDTPNLDQMFILAQQHTTLNVQAGCVGYFRRVAATLSHGDAVMLTAAYSSIHGLSSVVALYGSLFESGACESMQQSMHGFATLMAEAPFWRYLLRCANADVS